ncbi:hypothetical protein [Neomoorella mulderi]|uniref:Periplasmic nitrate reductase n=1 Tax=Moorella mulderi DSM 14980 TaxID=1122241 RepID=A0A151AZS2_9FIRM|nr:hypothetical protein [Moorella mulderi]KYH33151.1 periplasmic nitrate reductase precursor [Moorella mulderi DSM 14980]
MATYRSVCPLDCPDACGLLIEVNDGRVTKVSGDPEHPYTRGYTCAKMRHYPQLIHSPERILTPLKRSGPKGSGLFTPISWTEAPETVVDADLVIIWGMNPASTSIHFLSLVQQARQRYPLTR